MKNFELFYNQESKSWNGGHIYVNGYGDTPIFATMENNQILFYSEKNSVWRNSQSKIEKEYSNWVFNTIKSLEELKTNMGMDINIIEDEVIYEQNCYKCHLNIDSFLLIFHLYENEQTKTFSLYDSKKHLSEIKEGAPIYGAMNYFDKKFIERIWEEVKLKSTHRLRILTWGKW